MYATYHHVAIRAIAAVAPVHVLDNEAYAATVKDRRYQRRILYTGIKRRHTVVGRQRASDLASIAAEKVLQHLHWDKNSVKVLIFVTQSPDLWTPATAMLIQMKLGLGQELLAFDVNLGCSGFTSSVPILASILRQTKGRGLLLFGDCQQCAAGTEYSEDSILFGDGGAAVAMEYDEVAESIPCAQMTDGSRAKILCSTFDHGRIMDGNEIVLFSLNEVVDSINAFYDHYCISHDTVDFYALHQAQKIIVNGIAENCQMKSEKVLTAYQEYGNTSSVSIPFALCANTDKFSKNRVRIFTCGYGVGLAWSSALITLDVKGILPIIESDYTYPSFY